MMKNLKAPTVSQVIDAFIRQHENHEIDKNGAKRSGAESAKPYRRLHNSLDKFTKTKYKRPFDTYSFSEVGEKFLLTYAAFLKQQEGGVSTHLRKLRSVFYFAADRVGVPGINTSVFDCVRDELKQPEFAAKVIPSEVMRQIENIDRSQFDKKEQLHIDLLLFCYYTGGMSCIDMAYLTHNCVKGDTLCYTREKVPKNAVIPFIPRAKAIVEKYKGTTVGNYLLPIFTHKHNTEAKQTGRVKRIYERASDTFRKVQGLIGCDEQPTWAGARGTFIVEMLKTDYTEMALAEIVGLHPARICGYYSIPIMHGEM